MGELGLSGAYRTTYAIDPRMAYYFSELFGIEAFYSTLFNSENGTFTALEKQAPNTLPQVREIHSEYAILLHYVPWYAKINVYNTILHFDWYFSGGYGGMSTAVDTRTNASSAPSYVDQTRTALFLGTGQLYHLNEVLDVRLDLTGAFYKAPLLGLSGDEGWFTNFTFGVGLGLRL